VGPLLRALNHNALHVIHFDPDKNEVFISPIINALIAD
jgi:hypothetical protein